MTPPSPRSPRLGAGLWAAVMIQALVLAWGAVGGARAWGVHAWTFLPPAGFGGLVLVAAGAAWLVWRPVRFPTRTVSFLAMAAGAVPVFWLLRDRSHLLGDGRLWISVLSGRPVYHAHEPLGFAAYAAASLGVRGEGPQAVAARLEWLSIGLGSAALVLAAALAVRLGRDDRGRWLCFLLLAASGLAQFGFGYVEAYPVLWVAVLAYLLLALRYADTGAGLAWVGLALGAAAGIHGLGALLAAPTLGLLARRRPGLKSAVAAAAAAAAPVAFAYLLLPQWMPSASGEAAGVDNVAAGSAKVLLGMQFYPHGAAAWILDQVNRWSLAAPLALPLIALAAAARRPADPALRTRVVVLAAAAGALMLPPLLLDTDGSRGSAVDWDTFAVAGVPLALLAAALWGGGLPRAPLATAAALAAFTGLGFVAVNASPRLAAERLETLTASPTWTDNSRGIAFESLATFHRDRGDTTAAAAMYLAGVPYQRGNPRYLRNAATVLAWQGRHREAADVYAQLTSVSREPPEVWMRFAWELEQAGSLDSTKVALRYVLTQDDRNVDAMNQLARALLTHDPGPEEQREAFLLLSRSLALRPGQPAADGIRRTLSALEARGAGGGN